jgi:hypothetical protein
MKSVVIGGVTVEIDQLKSVDLEDDGGWPRDWCQCDGCTTARMARLDAAPQDQTKILRALGLNPLTPTHSAWTRQSHPRSSQYGQRICCWFGYGKILSADCTPRVRFDKFNEMWVDSRRPVLNSTVENLMQIKPDDPGMIYIVTSNRLLWLHGEVCSFRQDYSAAECPDCGSRWRESGYLKRTSLIPDWKGVPHLNEVLRAREKRVYVEFCAHCGRMDYEIVDRKRPFRRKNNLYRDEQRERRPRLQRLNWPAGESST